MIGGETGAAELVSDPGPSIVRPRFPSGCDAERASYLVTSQVSVKDDERSVQGIKARGVADILISTQ